MIPIGTKVKKADGTGPVMLVVDNALPGLPLRVLCAWQFEEPLGSLTVKGCFEQAFPIAQLRIITKPKYFEPHW